MSKLINEVFKGIMAGFIATVVLSMMLLIKYAMGLMPQLNLIQMLSEMAGAPARPVVAWGFSLS